MCDYSLESLASREAQVGDVIVSCSFRTTTTRGFCSPGEPEVAVCLRPGTELAFENPVQTSGIWGYVEQALSAESRLARFRQIDMNKPGTHHDALELADGRIFKVNALREGQRATVLQLPKDSEGTEHHHHDTVVAAEPARETALT